MRYKNKRRILIKICSTLAVGVLLLACTQLSNDKFRDLTTFDDRSSLASRVMIWKASFKMLSQEWFLGIGAGNFQSKYLEYQKYFPPYLEWAVPQPHNLLLAFWLQAGLIGVAGFLWLMFLWLKSALRKVKRNATEGISCVLLAIMAYVLLHGLVDTTYWKNDLAIIFWVIFFLL